MSRKRTKGIELAQLDQRASAAKAASAAGCGDIKPSTRSRWRALSLLLVHVAFALHLAHWWTNGKTITPVEPSEAMQTLSGEALVNTGFILFALTILSTLVFGRFFCGWGCHLIAYQDICTWLLKKAGIKPQPFRSRLLLFVPLAAAIFMFIMPTAVRLIIGSPRAPYSMHLTTYDFWDRFPGLFVGSLSIFVCGFAIVYFLGNKGFCTYACPYGGFFGLADKVAPGRIRVTDACEQCGHCTAACSSNVRVHEEVNTHGMVVNPGCMKCLDCISVCPKDALFFGFRQAPNALTKLRPAKSKRYDYSWPEEIALASFFLVSVIILRKLYDGVPFLLALALASIGAYAMLTAARLAYKSQLRFVRFTLRSQGKTTRAGFAFATIVAIWCVFLGHSALVQLLTVRGRRSLHQAHALASHSDDRSRFVARGLLDQGVADLETADRIGLVPVANVLYDLSMSYMSRGENERAIQGFRRTITAAPRLPDPRYQLAGLLQREGVPKEAMAEMREVVRVAPEFPNAHSDLANWLIELGRSDEAVAMLEGLIEQRPDVVDFHLTLGLTLAHDGQSERAVAVLSQTAARWPEHPDAHYFLGSTLSNRNDHEAALTAFKEAARLNPRSGPIHFSLAGTAIKVGRLPLADAHLLAARDLDPFNHEYVRAWVGSVHRRDALDSEITTAEQAAVKSKVARFRLVYLYAAAGRNDEARRQAAEFASEKHQ